LLASIIQRDSLCSGKAGADTFCWASATAESLTVVEGEPPVLLRLSVEGRPALLVHAKGIKNETKIACVKICIAPEG